MKIGLIGLEKSGKTTIFNALTNMNAEAVAYKNSSTEPNISKIDVLDPRVEILSKMYEPGSTVYASIEMVDFAGIESGSAKEGIFSQSSMGLIKTTNALAVVLRNYSHEVIDGTLGPAKPAADLDIITGELTLGDLMLAEKRVERIEADYKRGKKTPQLEQEEKVMRLLIEQLYKGKSVRDIELSTEETRLISGFQFLTQKQILVVVNSDEKQYGKNKELIDSLSKNYPVIEFAGNFEMELGRLPEDEAKAFMEDFGITQSARSRLTTKAFEVLGLINFFTVGKDEVRAWTIRRGDDALTAAGTIHSDLAKGFIRAECFSYDDLIACGTEKGIKEKGKFRLEGKEYQVHDGDILNIRFN
jgi:GTP-binding protein YchF